MPQFCLYRHLSSPSATIWPATGQPQAMADLSNPYATRVTAHVGSNSETDRRIEMPLFRYFRESAASGRGEIRVLVIAGEPIYANVRLRLTANRTYEVFVSLLCKV